MFNFSGNAPFGQIWSQKLKFKFKLKCGYAEFSGGAQFYCFRLEIPFFGKFGPNTQNSQ